MMRQQQENICPGQGTGAQKNGQTTTTVKTNTVRRNGDSLIKVTSTTKERRIVSILVQIQISARWKRFKLNKVAESDKEIRPGFPKCAPLVVVHIHDVDPDSQCAKHHIEVKRGCSLEAGEGVCSGSNAATPPTGAFVAVVTGG